MEKILYANTETGAIRYADVPPSWEKLGGRGLIARIMLDEVPAQCDPLGPFNKLILAPGLLVGHMLSSCDRISVGGKSPLTGGVKEANAGGTTAQKMVWLGLHALIVEGGPPVDGSWKILYISQDEARLDDGNELVELGLSETCEHLIKRYNRKIGISAIGPAGERLYRAASVVHVDKDRNLTRFSGRGGLGALMGSKHLKAIVLDQSRSVQPNLKDQELFHTTSKRFINALQNNPQTAEIYPLYGTSAMLDLCFTRGCLPTRNFSSGDFEGRNKINSEAIYDLNKLRGGETTHACMPGCIIRCSNIYFGPDGVPIVTPLEYETLGMMGSNLGIEDTDYIARLNALANDVGIDSIEAGAALGIAAEVGLMHFGDGERAIELMKEVQKGTPLGRILGNGVAVAGLVLGAKRIPSIKGQAIPAYDPRAIKGIGVTYATSPQGADHTAGQPIRMKIDHTNPIGQVEISRNLQYISAAWDSLGVCIFGSFGFQGDWTMVRDLINARYGWEVSDNYIEVVGKETIAMEREFNQQAGFSNADDRIPEWMTREKLPPTYAVFDVPPDELDTIFDK